MTNLLTLLVLGICVGAFAYPDPMSLEQSVYNWNATNEIEMDENESREIETDDIEDDNYETDEFEDPEDLIAPSRRVKGKRSKTVLTFDFETSGDLSYFSADNSEKGKSSKFHKHRDNSLLWQWTNVVITADKPKLTLDLRDKKRTSKKEAQQGGIKFWMYREAKVPASRMKLVFVGTADGSTATVRTSPTDVYLDFKGWRGVWIAYQEFFGDDFKKLTKILKVEFEIQTTEADKLYIDLFQFSKTLSLASRDRVVKKVGQTSPGANSKLFHDDKDFWQQTFRWDQYESSRYTETITNTKVMLGDINTIEARIQDWYVKDTESILKLTDEINALPATDNFDFEEMKVKRWESLWEKAAAAHTLYGTIDFVNNRPPLFPKVAAFGKDKEINSDSASASKFGYVFAEVLLPMSLECALMSRAVEVRYIAKQVCRKLLATGAKFIKGIEAVAGKHETMKNKFTEMVNNEKTSIECPPRGSDARALHAERLIETFNDFRFGRIKTLLTYLQDQGIAAGSSLGSLDHEMNKIGSGFVHSVFVLRKRLRKEPMFNDLVNAMKWYTDFNEIYQRGTDYIYDGTTTDRMRTILLYRLLIILMKEVKGVDEIHDLNHLKEWIKNALAINKGLGGVVKPDFTGFHHKTFYGSAYVPQALHNAALVQYFLDGTSFELDQTSKDHIRKVLGVLRMVSVKYSTPNGICGRFPSYNKGILVSMIPAYAYISYVHPQGTVPEGVKDNGMFLRLFDKTNPGIKEYLERGAPRSWIYYWNTIGSLDVLKKVSTLKCASNKQCKAENSPSGHWSKNFASLSIHRRADWSVAAKGFSRYTWDFEGKNTENAFGVFASHGSLQISNSESALASYDVKKGWDWTKVPGATTVATDDLDTLSVKARTYNHRGFAGGVSFIGSSGGTTAKQGAFSMLFKKPNYGIPKEIPDSPLERLLEFRKSYFFYQHLIICLGSDINFETKGASDDVYPLTTLFQDKKLSATTNIKVNDQSKTLENDFSRTWSQQASPVTLKDTNGNLYKIKLNHASISLKVKISNQNSKKSDGMSTSSARYATAWLDHSKRGTTATPGTSDDESFSGDGSGESGQALAEMWDDEDDVKEFTRIKRNESPIKRAVDGGNQWKENDGNNHPDKDETSENTDEDQTTKTTTSSKYEYAIVINGGGALQLDRYTVIQQDNTAHIVQLNNQFNSAKDKVYGYSFFETPTRTISRESGPIRKVNSPCMIMAEKKSNILKIAISNHDFGLEYDPDKEQKETCTRKLRKKGPDNVFAPESNSHVGVKLMFCTKGQASKINVKLNHRVQSLRKVVVDGKVIPKDDWSKYVLNPNNKSRVKFLNLVNGFTTEVELQLKN